MKISLKTKYNVTLSAIKYVLSKPAYLLISLVASLSGTGIIVWTLNLSTLKYIFFDAPINLGEKLTFFVQGYKGLFTSFDTVQSLTLIVFSILFGINLSLLIFALFSRNKEKLPGASGGVALSSAILGGGCIACGTSLLTPILTTLGITSVAFIRSLGSIFLVVGSILTIYSIYKLSIPIGTIKAKQS